MTEPTRTRSPPPQPLPDHVRCSSSAPASPASAWRSSSTRPATTTSSCVERGARRRRHLARQHLPGRRLRRALAALLVLLRAQPGLVPLVLPAAGDPGLPRAGRRATPACSTGSSSTRRSLERALGRRRAGRWQVSTSAGERHRRRPGLRRRRASRDPTTARHRGLRRASRGEVFHSARWDHDARPAPASGSPSSAPAPRRSRSCPRSPPQVGAPRRLPAHRAVGDAAQRPRPTRGVERLAFRHVPGLQRLYRTAIYWGREMLRRRPSP